MSHDFWSATFAHSRWLRDRPRGPGLRRSVWVGGLLGALFGLGVTMESGEPLWMVLVPLVVGMQFACVSAKLYLAGCALITFIKGRR